MTLRESLKSETEPATEPVAGDRLTGVHRAGRMEPAGGWQDGRDEPLVPAKERAGESRESDRSLHAGRGPLRDAELVSHLTARVAELCRRDPMREANLDRRRAACRDGPHLFRTGRV